MGFYLFHEIFYQWRLCVMIFDMIFNTASNISDDRFIGACIKKWNISLYFMGTQLGRMLHQWEETQPEEICIFS